MEQLLLSKFQGIFSNNLNILFQYAGVFRKTEKVTILHYSIYTLIASSFYFITSASSNQADICRSDFAFYFALIGIKAKPFLLPCL